MLIEIVRTKMINRLLPTSTKKKHFVTNTLDVINMLIFYTLCAYRFFLLSYFLIKHREKHRKMFEGNLLI